MADSVLRIIPIDPRHVPSALERAAAEDVLRQALPRADEIVSVVTHDVRFVDCGANFETVHCPRCGTDIGEWWTLAMEAAVEQHFMDLRITTPCCGRRTSLNDLTYSWAMGFARYKLEAMNPDVFDLPENIRQRLERIFGCRVRLIWAHI
ncbi:MAG TPA: hypothetical protein VGQ62_14350 [Chloroflexota bacterium]|nr:hypothetical protein [Chloroflexota bacterium]